MNYLRRDEERDLKLYINYQKRHLYIQFYTVLVFDDSCGFFRQVEDKFQNNHVKEGFEECLGIPTVTAIFPISLE